MSETLYLIGGIIWLLGYDILLWQRVQWRIVHELRNVPQVVIGILGGLVAAIYCIQFTLTVGWPFTVWRWIVEWLPFPPGLTVLLACIAAPGPPMREGRETVPVMAMATVGAYVPSRPSAYNRFVGWLATPWHRALFRGGLIVVSGSLVLILRGDLQQLRGMTLVLLYVVLHAIAVMLNPSGPDEP